MKKLLTILLLVISLNAISQIFDDNFNGIDSMYMIPGQPAKLRTFYNDGDSILYIGGGFWKINLESSTGIFGWDGNDIETYHNVNNNPEIYPNSIRKYKDRIYMGGAFHDYWDRTRDFLAFWNGESWQGFESGQPNAEVKDMIIFEDKLWVCGRFGYVGEVNCDKIAAYDGTIWHNVGDFGMWAACLEEFNGDLYSGGYWGVRKYLGGTEWVNIEGAPNSVYCLRVDTFNTFLYIGSQAHTINGEPSIGICMWDGFRFHAMNHPDAGLIVTKPFVVYKGDLYSGHCYVPNEQHTIFNVYINRWDGEQWDSLGGKFNESILALEVFQDNLYIGGNFTRYDGMPSKGMRRMSFPDNGCDYIKARINTLADTFQIDSITKKAEVQFYNNNPYVDSWEWDFGDGGSAYIKDPLYNYTDSGKYEVKIIVTHEGCIKTYTKEIVIEKNYKDDTVGVGINTNESIKFEIYPNPVASSASATVEVGTVNGEVRLIISGLNGHIKADIPIKSNETIINTENWKPGMYICNLVIDGSLVKTEKIILK